MDVPKEVQPTGEFTCQLCGLTAPYTYFGQKPPNRRSIVLLEEGYVMKDPFTPDKDKFLILGSHCSLCNRSVCVATRKVQRSKTLSKVVERAKGRTTSLWTGFDSCLCLAQVDQLIATECSLFYSKRFCLPCVKENLKAFPLEIQEDIDKRKPPCEKRDTRT